MYDEILEKMSNIKDSPLFKTYGPSVEYAYQHPRYPTLLTLKSTEWLYDELTNPENANHFKSDLAKRILALPHDALRQDLEQIIMYHIGQTCDNIPDNYDANGYAGTICNAMVLLSEVGNGDSSLDVVLEFLRQNDEFYEYHFGDMSGDFLPNIIYKIGNNRLDKLMAFLKEEGLLSVSKSMVTMAVLFIAILSPLRRQEVIEWFRQLIAFAIQALPQTKSFDVDLAGFFVTDLIDIAAEELLPEIKELFATNLVGISICGKYDEVCKIIRKKKYLRKPDEITINIYDLFKTVEY